MAGPLDAAEAARLDALLDKALNFRQLSSGELEADVDESELMWLLGRTTDVLSAQPLLLRLSAPIRIVGDIHGQYLDLLRVFEAGGYPPSESYLFLGDYVDRGSNGLECMLLLMVLKCKYPNHVFLIRGNHECDTINRLYGFMAECKKRYSVALWEKHCELFNMLPLAAIVSDKIFCIHGGLSPTLESVSQIEKIARPLVLPSKGMVVDFLWSDPDADVRGWAESDRGISYLFGADVVSSFLKRHGFDLLVRAHQVVEAGYELFADRQLVTLFSAPNYCGDFDNAGAIMIVERDLQVTFKILEPHLEQTANVRVVSRPTTPLID
jgi:serine/threonine-protein phosphatase PP1 catalytic subunit